MLDNSTERAVKKSVPYQATETPGVYRRASRFTVKWTEDGRTRWRSFPTYEAACGFRRDYVLPYRERVALPPTTVAPGRRGLGWVYVFQSGAETGPVKIGWSQDPARRLRDLSISHHEDLHLVALLPGARALERRIHEAFGCFRLRGEWFSVEALHGIQRELVVASSWPHQDGSARGC